MTKNNEDLKKKLTPLQYEVTQNDGTEQPFHNDYWENKQEGIYVDVVSGEPLFSSQAKYDSGTGWPSFYAPLEPKNLVEKSDTTLLRPRTEVRSKKGDCHLGHVFDDGPKPTGKRYCMNSAAMRFIPKEKLAQEGYEKYLALFEHIAYFAGGCFWCVEADLVKIRGVKSVESGYMGGLIKHPSYEEVCEGVTGHAEAVKVSFDNNQISYEDLLRVFWLSIDPTVENRQFSDVGPQYRTAIFYINDDQKKAVEKSYHWLKETFPDLSPIVTEVHPAQVFYSAEEYHQRFFEKNPARYQSYRNACGRDERLKDLYGDKRQEILQAKLLKS